MPTEFIDGNTLRRIANLYTDKKAGSKPISDNEYRDSQCPGLCIKVRKRGATWCMLTRDINAKIGDFHLFKADDIPALRELVAEAKVQLKDGHKPDALFEAFRKQRDVVAAREVHLVIKAGAKTWEETRDEFLTWAMTNKSTQTADGYKSALGAAKNSTYQKDFTFIAGKPITSITHYDLSCVIESIVNRGAAGELKGLGIRQANLTVAAIRSLFKYARTKPSTYQLKSNPALELTNVGEKPEANAKSIGAAKLRAMTQFEIGAFISALDECDNAIARLVLFLQLLTGQRRFTACSALVESFVDHEHYGIIWRLRAKGNNWRVLPLPQMSQDIVLQARKEFAKYECEYLFPKERHKIAGDDMQMHINKRTVSVAMEAMREPGGVFHGSEISPSTHWLRKAFVSYMKPRMHEFSIGGKQLTKDDVKMITHINEGRDDTASAVYDLNDYLDVKLAILKRWEDYCMGGYTLYIQHQQTAIAA